MKQLYIVLFILTFPIVLLAQTNYHQGYVIKNNGDTLNGYINYREWQETPRVIEFKPSLQIKSATNFYPNTIQGFKLNNFESFITYVGPISTDNNVFPDLSDDLDMNTKIDTLFLKTIYANPNISLLSQVDDIKTRLFILEKGDKPVELKYYQFFGDGATIHNLYPFRQQLFQLYNKYDIQDDKKNAMKAERLLFNENDIKKFIKLINKDSIDAKVSSYRFFAGLIFNRTATQFNGDNIFSNATPSVKYLPSISVGIDMFMNPNVQKLIFRNELSFSYIKPKLIRPKIASTFTNPDIVYTFNQLSIILSSQIIYNIYNRENMKIFIGGGMNLNFSHYSNNIMALNDDFINRPYNLESLWASFPVQTGVAFNKKLDIFVKYITHSAYTDYTRFSISTETFSLGAHYYLTKRKSQKS